MFIFIFIYCHTPLCSWPLPCAKVCETFLPKVVPHLEEVHLCAKRRPDVGVDPLDIKEFGILAPLLCAKHDEGMPVPPPILVVFLCSIPS